VTYDEVYRRSLDDPAGLGRGGQGDRVGDATAEILDVGGAPFYRWSRGGRLNTCYSALDRHVLGGRATKPRSSTTARSPAPSEPTPTQSSLAR
jgi:propionyl-CoA synthetase